MEPPTSAAPTLSGEPDPRIHYDKVSAKWKFEDDATGKEFEYDDVTGKWEECLDEDVIKQQQQAYSVQGVDEATPAAPVLNRGKKRKKESNDDDLPAIMKGKMKKSNVGKTQNPAPPRQTAIFVSNLPPYTTTDLLHRAFSKGGVILEDSSGEPKIKLYHDPNTGIFKGEALIVYLREESVTLAITLLDDTVLEDEEGNAGSSADVGRMKVTKAEFTKKLETNIKTGSHEEVKKKRQGKQAEKLKQKLTDWSSDEEGSRSITNQFSKIVILRKMFTLAELEEDPSLLLDLKEEVRLECGKLGEVTNVVLYDKEPEGIMTVRFKDELAAQACVLKMNKRFFAGRQISAMIQEGKMKFQKTGGKEIVLPGKAEEEEEKKRLDDWGKWLEKGGD